ncbi:MAG: NAD(P)-binding protein, partial [Phycisphaerales bacterium]|nr:NAD(P)-binding protein [Phycisphaerales bacterium]
MADYDVVIAGGGHNALACAALLVKYGLKVLVAERNEYVGGGVVTREVTLPGFRHDLYGSSHVWIHVNPTFRTELQPELEKHGLKYIWSTDHITGHPNRHEGEGIIVYKDVDKTCDTIAQYSKKDARRYRAIYEEFAEIEPAVRFPVSTLPSPGALRVLSEQGCGMAALSGGEFERAWLSKAPMGDILFAGVGKSDDDIRAALDGIYSPLFQAGVTVDGRPPYYRGPTGWVVAESLEEIERIAVIAGSLRVNCRIAVRVNTALEVPADETVLAADADSKFGVSRSSAIEAFRRFEFRQHVRLAGLA